ncbi:MAG: hypothetical protein B7Y45_12440 [Sphingomonas sp. 28-66-16]|nr:MAG: hypothetical protein B7Y45_12440 [Sphingomonas sp. 28-66-16]
MTRRRREAREMSNEEFDAWLAASDRIDATKAAANEEGGPRLSLVQIVERAVPVPTDLLPPAPLADAPPADPDATATATAPPAAEPLDGIILPDSRKRLTGWSAQRQRLFLDALAETGSVHAAACDAGLSARSAYRLRARSPAFAAAWDTADQLAVGRLTALAFDRAIHGRTEQVWENGELVVEKRLPSDKLLMWLLARLDPRRFAAPWEVRKDGAADPQTAARAAFPAQLESLSDVAADQRPGTCP